MSGLEIKLLVGLILIMCMGFGFAYYIADKRTSGETK